jgi:hypothetical protein
MPQVSFTPFVAKETPQTVLQKRVRADRIAVMAAMETGNHEKARTIVRELSDVNLDKAKELRSDVIASYGITL